jgi:2',3'-cyclic-nucleotide 2'-phosphodiesterase/3'-nucleotidase
MRFRGAELEEDRELSLCLNNYRASGAGGYEVYAACEILRDQPEEISEQIIRYVDRHRDIRVDRTQWLKVQY